MAPNIGLRQSMQLRQQLVMTQRLQQALKLLQVPTLELEQILRHELQGNPLLEEIEPEEEIEDEIRRENEITAADEKLRETEQNPQDEDRDWGDSWDEGFRGLSNERGYDEEDELERPQKYIPSGQEDLGEQLQMAVPEGMERMIGEYIIGCLNEDGLLDCPLAEIAAYYEVSEEQVEEILKVIQGFDPPGVAARNLQECLLLQLAARGQADSDEAHIISNHFEALKNRKFSDIAREMKITPKEVQTIAQRIGDLDPRPGLSVNTEGARSIVPDLEVVKVDEDGDEYAVYLNDSNLPRLRVSQAYEGSTKGNEDAVKFIDEKKRHAEWVIKTIEQRRRTMIRVMEAIVSRAEGLFRKGRHRPETLDSAAGGLDHRHARIDRVPGHPAEIRADTPRRFSAEVLLQRGTGLARRDRGGGQGRQDHDPGYHREREYGQAAFGQEDRGHAAREGIKDRSQDRSQIPGTDGNSQRQDAQAILIEP